MAFDLQNLNASSKFWYGRDKKEWVMFRLIPDDKLKELRKKCNIRMVTKPWTVKETRQTIVAPAVSADQKDLDSFTGEQRDFHIENWHLEDVNGNEIPCEKDKKLKLWGLEPQFENWADACIQRLEWGEAKPGKEYIAYFDEEGTFHLRDAKQEEEGKTDTNTSL